MKEDLPRECDCLGDERLMGNVMYALQIARLEHLLVVGMDRDTAYELSKLEARRRQEAFDSGKLFLSILGVLETAKMDSEDAVEFNLSLPDPAEFYSVPRSIGPTHL